MARIPRRTRVTLATAAALALAAAGTATAASEQRISPMGGVNGSVAVISQPDSAGTRYIAGTFTRANPWDTGRGVALGTDSGRVLARFPKVGPTNNSGPEVQRVVADGRGGFFIAGSFTCVGGDGGDDGDCTDAGEFAANRMAHINADGSIDTAFNPQPNGDVLTLARDGGTLYVGGNFTEIGGASRARVAALDAAGRATAFNPQANNMVLALTPHGGRVYMSGTFTAVGGQARAGLAAADAATGALTAWAPVTTWLSQQGVISTIVPTARGIQIGGQIQTVGGQPATGLTAVTADTGAPTGWAPVLTRNEAGTQPFVERMTVVGGTTYIAGYFDSVSGASRVNMAAIAADGSITAWNPSPGTAAQVRSLVPVGDDMLVAGRFAAMGGADRRDAALLAPDGTARAWDAGLGESQDGVWAAAADGDVAYLGGNFTQAGGVPRQSLAAIDSGGHLTGWAPTTPSGGSATVDTIVPIGDRVYLAGEFASMSGASRLGLAATDRSGAVTGWNPSLSGAGVSSPVARALALTGDTLLIGGSFDGIGGTARAGTAAVRIGGACADAYTSACLRSWNPGAVDSNPNVLDGAVNGIAVIGGIAYIGGAFNDLGGSTRARLGAVLVDDACLDSYSGGACLMAWNPGNGVPQPTVFGMATDGTTLFARGSFSALVGRTGLDGIAAFDPGTGLASDNPALSWSPAPTSMGSVQAMAPTGDVAWLGGGFTRINGVARAGFAAVSTSAACRSSYSAGNCLLPWAPSTDAGAGSPDPVLAISPRGDSLLAGGQFTQVNRQMRSRLAAIGTDGTLGAPVPLVRPSLTAVSPGTVPTSGGTTVTLTGADLGTATRVRFGSAAATSVQVIDDATVRAVTPGMAAGTVDVSVDTRGGTATLAGALTVSGAAAAKLATVTSLTKRRLSGGRVLVTANIRFEVQGRPTSVLFEGARATRGTRLQARGRLTYRVPMLRGSALGKRVLSRTRPAIVVTPTAKTRSFTLRAIANGRRLPLGSTLRIVQRQADGRLVDQRVRLPRATTPRR